MTVVDRVIAGEFGTGVERIIKLTKAGYDAGTVQKIVNEKLKEQESVKKVEIDLEKVNALELIFTGRYNG